jgi:hypothetical protein
MEIFLKDLLGKNSDILNVQIAIKRFLLRIQRQLKKNQLLLVQPAILLENYLQRLKLLKK